MLSVLITRDTVSDISMVEPSNIEIIDNSNKSDFWQIVIEADGIAMSISMSADPKEFLEELVFNVSCPITLSTVYGVE